MYFELLFNLIIFIQIFSCLGSQKSKNFSENYDQEIIADTLIDICDDGKIDLAFRTIDGKIYLFKRNGFVLVTIDGIKTNTSYKIKDKFINLPMNIDFIITITDETSVNFGYTYFIDKKNIYEYYNTNFTEVYEYPNILINYNKFKVFFNYFGDSTYFFFEKKIFLPGFYYKNNFIFISFKNAKVPTIFVKKSINDIPNYFNYIKQVIPLPNDKWLIFLDYDTYGSFCIIENVTENSFECQEKKISELLNCPNSTRLLIKNSFFLSLWELTSLNQDRVLVFLKGIMISFILGETVLFLITYYLYLEIK